jgi:DNA-binding response OmpR family regulator
MKILLIDERPDAVEFLGESIVNYGYKAGIAKNKSEILPMLSEDRYQVVVTNGGSREFNVDQDIRLKYPSVFVIHLTGSDNQNGNKDLAVDLCLRRPFEVSKLLNAIKKSFTH